MNEIDGNKNRGLIRKRGEKEKGERRGKRKRGGKLKGGGKKKKKKRETIETRDNNAAHTRSIQIVHSDPH